MKKYFTKLLQVEGEIEEGDWVLNTDNNTTNKMTAPYNEPQYSALNAADHLHKVKLFLCSRDIKFGRGIYYKNSPVEYGSMSRDTRSGMINLHLIKGEDHVSKGGVPEKDCIQRIGEISPEATWVKEGMEFDKDELRIPDAGSPVTKLIYIKGPCGHYH